MKSSPPASARQETLQLLIDGAAVRTWTGVKGTYNSAVYETFRFTTPSVVALNQIRVAFTNNGLTSTGLDKNLRVDAVLLNGVRYETEANDTFSTGGPLAAPTGFRRSEFLYNNGYFAYGQPFNPGTLSIAASQYTVVEGTPTVGVTFVRGGQRWNGHARLHHGQRLGDCGARLHGESGNGHLSARRNHQDGHLRHYR